MRSLWHDRAMSWLSDALLHPLISTTDRDLAERSPLIWGVEKDGTYRLTPLGIINTGLEKVGLALGADGKWLHPHGSQPGAPASAEEEVRHGDDGGDDQAQPQDVQHEAQPAEEQE
jgi:hypothetical protein